MLSVFVVSYSEYRLSVRCSRFSTTVLLLLLAVFSQPFMAADSRSVTEYSSWKSYAGSADSAQYSDLDQINLSQEQGPIPGFPKLSDQDVALLVKFLKDPQPMGGTQTSRSEQLEGRA